MTIITETLGRLRELTKNLPDDTPLETLRGYAIALSATSCCKVLLLQECQKPITNNGVGENTITDDDKFLEEYEESYFGGPEDTAWEAWDSRG